MVVHPSTLTGMTNIQAINWVCLGQFWSKASPVFSKGRGEIFFRVVCVPC